jgi:mRNA interferase MazF
MKPGDVVLTPLPQADAMIKNRPAVALCQMPPFGDWLICGISTQLHQQEPQFDELVDASDSDFAASGLKATSIIRLGFLAVMPASRFLGVIGSISNERRLRLLNKLSEHLRAQ